MFSLLPIQKIHDGLLPHYKGQVDVLRLDKVHTIVSGNKWFKLKYFLEAAKSGQFKSIATFGGAYSNHIIACAYAAKLSGLACLGIIRGEQPAALSPTLREARAHGMELIFVSRSDYKDKAGIQQAVDPNGTHYWIPEGGYGLLGTKGIRELYTATPIWTYTHIFMAVGTGTTLAGFIKGALPYQQITGVSVLKNAYSLKEEITALLTPQEIEKDWQLLENYHFGGYAKKTPALLDFMNICAKSVNLPLDFVYTAKAFFALDMELSQAALPPDAKPLFIHTGGLQGNQSLSDGIAGL